MKLLKLRIENINSLAGVHEIDFTDPAFSENGIFAIVGPTGSGKSSVLDAVTLALYGMTPRMKERSNSSKDGDCMVLTKGRRACSAQVVFEADGAYWRSRWGQRLTRTGKTAPAEVELVRLAGPDDLTGEIVAEQKRSWDKAVTEVLHMDFETFTRSALLAQGAFASLLRAKLDERAQILEKITGTAIYSKVSETVYRMAAERSAEVSRLEAFLEGTRPLEAAERAELESGARENAAEIQRLSAAESELGLDLQWVRGLSEAETALERARGDEAVARARMPEAQVGRSRAEAAVRAARPAAELRAARAAEAERDAARGEAGRLAPAVAEGRERLEAARSAHAEAARRREEAARRETDAEPELRAMEAADRAAAEAASALNTAEADEKKWAERVRARTESHERAKADAERVARGTEAAEAALRAVAGDAGVGAALPGIAAAAQEAHRAYGVYVSARDAREAAGAEAKRTAAERDRTRAEEARLRAACVGAEGRFAAAEREREAACAGSSVERQLLAMRERAGDVWAAGWLAETLELLAAAGALPECPAASEIRGVLTNRSAALRGRLAEAVGESVTPEAIAALEAAVNAIEGWAKTAGEADRAVNAARRALDDARRGLADAGSARAAAEAAAAVAETAARTAAGTADTAGADLLAARDAWTAAARPWFAGGEVPRVKEALEALRRRRDGYEAAAAAAEGARKALEAARAGVSAAEAARRAEADAHGEICARLDACRKARDERVGARRSAWGERSAEAERRELARVRSEAEASERRAAKAAGDADAVLRADEARLAAARSRAEAAASAAAEARGRFSELLAGSGFAGEAELLAAELDAADIDRLTKAWSDADRVLAEARSRAAAAEGRVRAALEHPRRRVPEEEIAAELARTKEALAGAAKRRGEIDERLRRDDEVIRQSAQRRAELDAARTELSLWARLSGLIGSAGGAKFRTAAQRLTFALLLKEANVVLQRMQSRYQLVAAGEAGLDLSVRDMELAGLERTSFNLSGGETFLVSLALALALSRVSSSRMRVDTLFLDEGFGTLDPVVLEKALTALEMLQQRTGKLIGLISHVRAVRERVGVHLTVRPKGSSGESELSGPGVSRPAE